MGLSCIFDLKKMNVSNRNMWQKSWVLDIIIDLSLHMSIKEVKFLEIAMIIIQWLLNNTDFFLDLTRP